MRHDYRSRWSRHGISEQEEIPLSEKLKQLVRAMLIAAILVGCASDGIRFEPDEYSEKNTDNASNMATSARPSICPCLKRNQAIPNINSESVT